VLVRLELASFDVAGVLLNIGVPFLGKVIQRENRRNRANWYACATVDALDGVNKELVNLFETRAGTESRYITVPRVRTDAPSKTGV
jgi:hypothetical protein